jgi:Tol biopolymer transport system component
MSPEQSRGMSVDKRTDIWAFGCLVFEMLTGRRAFDGATVADVFAEVVKTEPDWGALPRLTPALVSAVLRRCLRKDPVHRLHDIADARIEIQEALGNGNESELGAQSPVATKVWILAPWAIATLSLVALLATQVAPRRGVTPPAGVTRLEMTFPPDVEPYIGPAALAFSPDGSRVAFVGIKAGNRQLFVRRLDDFEAEPVPRMDGATAVFFSPSGRSLAVISTNRTMKRISLDDALVVPLTTDVDFTAGGAWGPDDLITFGRDGVLWQIPVAGGTATQLTTLDRNKGEVLHAFPTALANGKGLLFTTVTGPGRGAAHIEALSISGGAVTRHRLVESATSPAYVESGRFIFFRDGSLFASRFDQERWAVTGVPVKVIEKIGATASGAPMWAVSRSGSVAYMRGTVANRLVWVSRNGQERPLTTQDRQYVFPRLSAAREQLVVSAGGDLWLQDTPRQVFSKVTTDSTTGNTYPAWTRDGSRIVFRTNTGLYSTAADGSGRSELVPGTTAADFPNSISPDNNTLIFLRTTGATGSDLYVTSLQGSEPPRAWVATTAHEGGAQFSPDGKWVAYASNEAGQFQVFLRPFPLPDRKWLVAQTGKYVTWNRNGRELFYRNGDNMMAVRVSFHAGEPTFSVPALVFTGAYEFGTGQTVPNYDVSTDGQQFLMVKSELGSSRLNVVLHAFDGLTTPPETSR